MLKIHFECSELHLTQQLAFYYGKIIFVLNTQGELTDEPCKDTLNTFGFTV